MKNVLAGLRTWLRRPGFVVAAWVSLVLGIGVNAAIFTLIDATFLRPVPVEEPDRLVSVSRTVRQDGVEGTDPASYGGSRSISWPDFKDFRERTESLEGLTSFFWFRVSLAGGSDPERVTGMWVSGDYFEVLGVRPAAGRLLTRADEGPAAEPVAVISHGAWSRLFGADPAAVGETITVNGASMTVVGVAPRGFHGTRVGTQIDVWMPAEPMFERTSAFAHYFGLREVAIFFAVGRLADGTTLEQAQSELHAQAIRLAEEFPKNDGLGATARPFLEGTLTSANRERYSTYGWTLAIPAALILLIACLNVSNLLLARGVERGREMAVRQAMGASRGRLTRQLLGETLLLFLGGGLLSLPVANWTLDLLGRMRLPLFATNLLDIELDLMVWALALATALLLGLIFGALPALRAARVELVSSLKETEPASAVRGFGLRLRQLQVALQVALAFAALIYAGLLGGALGSAADTDLGYEPENLAMLTVTPGDQGYDDATARTFYRRAAETAAALPGARSAGVASQPPLNGSSISRDVYLPGASEDDPVTFDGVRSHKALLVGPGYFEAAGIGLVEGRDFTNADLETIATAEAAAAAASKAAAEAAAGESPAVEGTGEVPPSLRRMAVINRTMAETVWPGESAVGRQIHLDFPSQPPVEVIGVVEDAKYQEVREDPIFFLYFPMGQGGNMPPAATLHVRTEVDPEPFLPTLRREIQALDATMPLADLKTIQHVADEELWLERSAALLLHYGGLLGLLLAVIGVYGVMAYSVSRRGREMAMRMAVGAQRPSIVWMVLAETFVLVALGLVVGWVVSWWLLRWETLALMLHGMNPFYPLVWIGASAVLLVAALLGGFIPAWRAASVLPMRVLRQE